MAMTKTVERPRYETIEVSPIGRALGAEIRNVDLGKPLGDAVLAEIRRAFLQHLVIFFPGQRLAPEDLKRFGRCFGPLSVHRFIAGLDGHPEILPIIRKETDTHVFAEGWHADVTYQERPILGALLYAVEVPETGGDTIFANQYLAYERLSPGMRRMLDGLVAIHGGAAVYGAQFDKQAIDPAQLKQDRAVAAATETEHPVVRTHPETGRKALFVNAAYTLRFKDMTAEESRPLLDFLLEHATDPDLTCRYRWSPGALTLWDNRCVLHRPVNDYFGSRRVMHRVAIEGDRPR
jgi:taurine dioxygenase